MTERRGALQGWVGDLALAALVVAFLVAVSGQLDTEGSERPLDALGYVCVIVAGAALAGRRRWPLAVVGVITAVLLVYIGREYPGGPVFATLFVALYALATIRGRKEAFVTAAASTATLVVVGEAFADGPRLVHLVFVGWAAAAVFLGDAVRSRRGHLAALEERAAHLEQSREEEARRRVAEERLRIAQDLHDSVAHSMAVINVQAGMAEHVIDRHPDRAREALRVVRQASGEVLEELAALVGLLRREADGTEPRHPTPGPGDLPALLESARRSGLDVTLTVEGDLRTVSQPVGVAVYRIVQESLTNIARHAGPEARAVVSVTRAGDGTVEVEVADDGGRAAAPVPSSRNGEQGAGVGIAGMRERAEATGGVLSAAPRPGGGFVVRAAWPGRPPGAA